MLLQVLEVLLVTAGLGYFLIQLLNHINDKGEKESDENEDKPNVEGLSDNSTEEVVKSESTEEVRQDSIEDVKQSDSIETQSDVIDEAIFDELGQTNETVSPRIDEEVSDETKDEIKSKTQTLSDTVGGKKIEELEQLAAEDVGGDAEEITAEIDLKEKAKIKENEKTKEKTKQNLKTKEVKENEVEDNIESAKVVDDLFRDVLPDDVIEEEGPVTADGVRVESENEMPKEGARSESESAVIEEVNAEEEVSPKIVETVTEKVARSDDVVDLNEDEDKDEGKEEGNDAKDAKLNSFETNEVLDDDDFNVLDEFGDEQLLLLNFGKASRPKKPRVRKSVKKVFSESWQTSVFEVSFVSLF